MAMPGVPAGMASEHTETRPQKVWLCKSSAKDSTRQSQPTFAEAQPPELAQWNYECNDAEGFSPHNVTLGSDKQVHWICSCCPKGQPHRWTARPNDRISKGHGCPVCDGKQACVCNSLESLFPFVAAELDADQNGFSSSDITACSSKKVWWRNAKRGSWKQSVNSRTDKRRWPNTKQGGVSDGIRAATQTCSQFREGNDLHQAPVHVTSGYA
ncbi:hypothetical protein ABBQ32_003558 [Trebouxia sp. C0010 RCD-2024]